MSRYEFIAEQSDSLPNEDVKIVVEKSRTAALASELMAEDAEKIEPKKSGDKFDGFRTSDVGYPEYTEECLINRVAELDPKSRTSMDGINRTPQLLGEAVKSKDVTPGTMTRVRHSPNNYIFKNYSQDILQRVAWEKSQKNIRLSTFEAIALINPDVTSTKAVLIETKRDHGSNAEVVAQAAAQKMIMERSGVRMYTKQEVTDGDGAKLVKERLLDVIKWGESNTGRPNTLPNVTQAGVVTKPGFVSTPKNDFVRVGYTVSYDNSSPETNVITIQNTKANEGVMAGSTAKVIIEVYPSRADLLTDPKIKQVYIESDGVKIPLKINLNGEQGLDEINKIAWLFIAKVNKPAIPTLAEPSTDVGRERKALSKKRDEVFEQYNNFLADRNNNWNSRKTIQQKLDLEAELTRLNYRLANPDIDMATFSARAQIENTPIKKLQGENLALEQELIELEGDLNRASTERLKLQTEILRIKRDKQMLQQELNASKAKADAEKKAREDAEQQAKETSAAAEAKINELQDELTAARSVEKVGSSSEQISDFLTKLGNKIPLTEAISILNGIENAQEFDPNDPENRADRKKLSDILDPLENNPRELTDNETILVKYYLGRMNSRTFV